MNTDYWLKRWESGEIGFHQEAINPYLVKYFDRLKLRANAHCFVPLCGKSMDMNWIREKGQLVTGIDISPIAVESQSSEPLRIIQGDFFELKPSKISPPVDWIYDRAALVAFPPALQPSYVKHLETFLDRGKKILLVTFEYDQKEAEGPAFAVTEKDVHRLFSERFSIEFLERKDVLHEKPRWREKGVTWLFEAVYLLTKN